MSVKRLLIQLQFVRPHKTSPSPLGILCYSSFILLFLDPLHLFPFYRFSSLRAFNTSLIIIFLRFFSPPLNMVISAQDTAASHPPDSSLTMGPKSTPPPSPEFTFPISKPRNNLHAAKSDAPVAIKSRPWNLRSKRGSAALHPKERARFSLALSCDEIAEDIYAVTGSLPQRRPKKRPRIVQKQVEVNLLIT